MSSGVVLQSRDISLFRGLYESRVMTIDQIAKLYFAGQHEMARKRVAKLKAAKFLSHRLSGIPTLPSSILLGELGLQALEERKLLEDVPKATWKRLSKRIQVSDATLIHELHVVDAKVAFVTAIDPLSDYNVSECSTWPALHRFDSVDSNGRPVTVYPDGYMRIQRTDARGLAESSYFLEIDRSTESLNVLVDRCVAYRNFYRDGGFAEQHSAPRNAFREFYFRVLITCVSEERRNNIAERLLMLDPPILSQVWLTTQKELVAHPLDAIWIRPKDLAATVDRIDAEKSYLSPHTPIKQSLIGHIPTHQSDSPAVADPTIGTAPQGDAI